MALLHQGFEQLYALLVQSGIARGWVLCSANFDFQLFFARLVQSNLLLTVSKENRILLTVSHHITVTVEDTFPNIVIGHASSMKSAHKGGHLLSLRVSSAPGSAGRHSFQQFQPSQAVPTLTSRARLWMHCTVARVEILRLFASCSQILVLHCTKLLQSEEQITANNQ